MSHLTDYELEQLLQESSARTRDKIVRLVAELRELREQAAEREVSAQQEQEW